MSYSYQLVCRYRWKQRKLSALDGALRDNADLRKALVQLLYMLV